MPNRYTPEFKKHQVEAWRASGLTRRQRPANSQFDHPITTSPIARSQRLLFSGNAPSSRTG